VISHAKVALSWTADRELHGMLKDSRSEGARLRARRRDQGLCLSGAVRGGGR
jgi:hypothetical protein